jgi:hypothetical protein
MLIMFGYLCYKFKFSFRSLIVSSDSISSGKEIFYHDYVNLSNWSYVL